MIAGDTDGKRGGSNLIGYWEAACVSASGSLASSPGLALFALTAMHDGIRAAEPREEVKHVPLGGTLTGQMGDHYFGVYVPTRFGGNLTITPSSGPSRRSRDRTTSLAPTARRPGSTLRVVSLQGRGQGEEGSPYSVETKFVQVAQSKRHALELLLLAHEVGRHPRTLGGGQRSGRHDAGLRRRHHGGDPRRLHRSRSGHRSRRCQWPPGNPGCCRRRHQHLVPQPL